MFCAFAVNFLSAMWFSIRIWQREHGWFAKSVGFLTIFAGLIAAFVAPLFGIWISAMPAPILILQSSYKNWHRHKIRDQQVRELVEGIILEMRAGRSFRLAIAKVSTQLQDDTMRERLKIWLSSPQIEIGCGSEASWWPILAQELSRIDRQSHQALACLQQWRGRLKLESDFRRRFGQVAVQVRLQAAVVAVLYFAIFLVSLFRGTWKHDRTLILVSLMLFVVGLGLIFRLGRRVKWTF